MADYNNNLQTNQNIDKSPSRIQTDTKTLQEMVSRVRSCESRIVRHAMSLGYFQPTPDAQGNKPTPVSTSLLDAIGDLDRALDSLSGSLNLFD